MCWNRTGLWGVVVQFGGQTAIKTGQGGSGDGLSIIGRRWPASTRAEGPAKNFEALLEKLDIRRPSRDGGQMSNRL